MSNTRGFTLVELLVAIVLVALASTLVMQGIGQGLGLVGRVTRDQGAAYHELMARGWIRDSIGAAAALASAEGEFRGTANAVTLLSFRPLLGSEGVASPISWSAGGAGRLVYAERDQSVPIAALPPLGYIEYQDTAGNWQPSWPPPETNASEAGTPDGALPRRLRFVFAQDDTLELALPAAAPIADEEFGEDEGDDLGGDDDGEDGEGPDAM